MIRKHHALAAILAVGLLVSNLGGYSTIKPTILADTESTEESDSLLGGGMSLPTVEEPDDTSGSEASDPGNVPAPSENGIQPADITIDEKNFPDKAFRNYVLKELDLDNSGTLSENEWVNAKTISLREADVESVKGIEFFTNAEVMDFSRNKINNIDISKNTHLRVFTCTENRLGSLDVSNNLELEDLHLSNNYITSLDVSMLSNLDCLIIRGNKLTSLNVSKNIKLRDLSFENNNLTSIDVSKNTELSTLGCGNNKITKLDISKNTKLTHLTCYMNALGSLDISKNTKLTSLSCGSCNLSSLDVSKNPELYNLYVEDNKLTSLNVSNNPELRYLACENNSLSVLDVSKNTHLYCLTTHGNQLSKLDVSNCDSLVWAIDMAYLRDKGSYYIIIDPDKGDTLLSFDKTTALTPQYKIPTPTPTTTPDPYEPEPTATPAPQPNSGFEKFVERLYKIALNREPEKEGMDFWVNHVVNDGATGADCARFFLLDAPEFMNRNLNNDKFVDTLYSVFFDRAAEAGGKAYWVGQLNSGVSKRDVVNGFIESTEWCNVCAGYGVKSGAVYHKATKPSDNALAFATRLYTCCLGRDPEDAGLKYWALALTNLEQDAAHAALLFFTSEELVNAKISDETFVYRLYSTFMDRYPEQEGLTYWLTQLVLGTSREALIKQFAESPEFTALCKQYGIERGTLPQPQQPVKTKETITVLGMSSEVEYIINSYLAKHPDIASKYDFEFKISNNDGQKYETILNIALQNDIGDIYAAEADYIYPYTQGDFSVFAAPYDELISDFSTKFQNADLAPYAVSIGTRASDGKVVGLGYQSTPGVFIYRRSIAKDVFGSDSPDVVEKAIGAGTNSWDTYLKAAEKLHQKGYAIVSSNGDIWNVVDKAAKSPWVVSGKLVIDPIRDKFFDLSKTNIDNSYCNDTSCWTESWYADMKDQGQRKVFGWFGPAWLINYVIRLQAEEVGNTGDWAVCQAPYGFYWGGSWIMANKKVVGTEKGAVIADILEYITLDCTKDGLQYQWAKGNIYPEGQPDSVASRTVMKMLSDESWSFLGGQNPFPTFIKALSTAHSGSLSPYNNMLNGLFMDLANSYAHGEMPKDEAIARFMDEAEELDIEVS